MFTEQCPKTPKDNARDFDKCFPACDMTNTTQLVVFVHGATTDVESAGYEITKGEDLLHHVPPDKFEPSFEKLSGLATDGAPRGID